MKKVLWISCVLISLAIIIVSSVKIVEIKSSRAENRDYYSSVQKKYFNEQEILNSTASETGNSAQNYVLTNKSPVTFESLLEENPNAIGWIFSPGTMINYPVVIGTDNNYYLNHMVDGRVNAGGAIFVDYQNKPDFSDNNTVIYGHHMRNNSMFGSICEYKNQSYYDEHKVIYLFTRNANYLIELVCGFNADADSDIYRVPANVSLVKECLDYGIKNSTFVSDIEVKGEDKLVTLSTCSNDTENTRFVVIGKLVRL